MIEIEKLAENWFLSEPALFAIYCMHETVENIAMGCPVRTGKGKIEFNPNLLSKMDSVLIEEHFTAEMVRAFLKHPYERQPESCKKEAIGMASDMVIGQHYAFRNIKMIQADTFQLPEGECFEWYARQINNQLWNERNNSNAHTDKDREKAPSAGDEEKQEGEGKSETGKSSKGNGGVQDNGEGSQESILREAAERAELWEEDVLQTEAINSLIESTTHWGSIPGDIVSLIKASTIVHLDYRKVLSGYHTSILSTKRCLTRMRPNRRSGFLQMGSRYDLRAKLMVAVDVSGSINNTTLDAFFSTISRFFKYGVETIDVVQFDSEIHTIQPLEKAKGSYTVEGRGGTDIQPVFNYLKEHNSYDGLIVFTDGFMPKPNIDFLLRAKQLWILPSEALYLKHKDWLSQLGRCCWIEW